MGDKRTRSNALQLNGRNNRPFKVSRPHRIPCLELDLSHQVVRTVDDFERIVNGLHFFVLVEDSVRTEQDNFLDSKLQRMHFNWLIWLVLFNHNHAILFIPKRPMWHRRHAVTWAFRGSANRMLAVALRWSCPSVPAHPHWCCPRTRRPSPGLGRQTESHSLRRQPAKQRLQHKYLPTQ